VRREAGCGLWTVWLIVALFAAEWLFLWVVMTVVPREYLALAVLSVAIVTIIGAVVAVYLRMQRRME